MAAALKAVIEDGMSVRGAAEYYGVPKSTLGDRVSGRVLPGVTSGRCTYLSHEEEEELVTAAPGMPVLVRKSWPL